MVLKVISYPTVEPITIEEARDHLNLVPYGSPPQHWKDPAILRQLPTARRYCEQYLGFKVAQATMEFALDEFPDVIEIPLWPVLSVESVRYIDVDGAEQTIDELDYIIDDYTRPVTIVPYTDLEWPVTKVIANAVKVRFHTGSSLTGDSPQTYPFDPLVRSAILLTLGDLLNNLENSSDTQKYVIPLGVQSLLDMADRERRGFA